MAASILLSTPPLRTPPPAAQRFHSDDLDEVREFVARGAGDHSRVVRGRGPLRFEQAWLTGESVVAGWVGTGLASTVRGAVRQPTLHLVLSGSSEYRFGRARHVAGPGTAMFVPPGWEYTTERLPGTSFAVAVGHARLVGEIGARDPSGRGTLLLRACTLAPALIEPSGLAAAVAAFLQAAAPAPAAAPVAAAEACLLGALAGLLRGDAAPARGTDVTAARLADLETWIDANLEAPISIGRLCAVAGVGERALQKSFESRRGMSPMRFVTERRLAAARRQLAAAGWRDDVTSIALRLGFDHPGRFAALYRQAYGEAPSQSLRRSRRPGRVRCQPAP